MPRSRTASLSTLMLALPLVLPLVLALWASSASSAGASMTGEGSSASIGVGSEASGTDESAQLAHVILERSAAWFPMRQVDLSDGDAWPGGVITWHAQVPPRYRWSVRHGIRAWSRTSSALTFVRVPREKATLLIGIGDTGGAAATATVGYQQRAHNRVTIERVPLSGWVDKQVYGRVVAHELGHVLGLRHSAGMHCGLMESSLDVGCVPPPSGNHYSCRWIGRAVGMNVVARYGGEFVPGPRWCRL